jgi:O-acetyl-ADP-ribose deacetylase (regulator of RNase III)
MKNDLEFLIHWLLEEGQADESIPFDQDGQWRLFRALVNTREPKPVGDEFLAVQNRFLQSLIAEKGVTDIDTLQPIRDGLYVWRGDITTLKADAIVNAANSGMLGCFVPNHACIDNAIHTFAGVQLRLDCAAIMRKQGYPEPTGRAKLTPAYNLPSSHVLHTVGPIADGQVTEEHRRQLADCYRACLDLADAHQIESVAFCCISTGEFRFPNEEAARIAIETVTERLTSCVSVKRVIFNVFKEQDERIYRELLG